MELPDVQSLPLDPSVLKGLLVAFVIVARYVITAILVFVLDRLSDRFPARRFFFKRLLPIPQIGGYAVAVFVIIRILSPDQSSLWALMGSAALAIGLAAQSLLQDIIGGVVVLVDASFQVGDRVRVGDYYGEVVRIGLRSTKIETPDDSLVTIPNSTLLQSAVSNTNAGAVDCLVSTHIYLPPNVDITAVETVAREAVLTSKTAHLDKPVTILIKDELIESRLLHLEVRAYVFDTRYEEMFATDLTRRIKKAFYENDLIPADFGPDEELYKEIRWDNLDGRIRTTLADSLIDLGTRFSRGGSAASPGHGKMGSDASAAAGS